MKIALAQIESLDGDVDANIARHLATLEHLRAGDADLVIFPELSLTNYQPGIAAQAAIDADDARLAPLEESARTLGVRVCIGAPLQGNGKPSITAILLSPGAPRRVIHKAYLHEDETPFFAAGCERASLLDGTRRVALAICHDINVDAHIEQAAAGGLDVYLASVAKTADGIAAARERLRLEARNYGVTVLVVNSVGTCEGRPAGGGSLVIDSSGNPVEALDSSEQAILIWDSSQHRAHIVPLTLPCR